MAKNVHTKHPCVDQMWALWQKNRDCNEGNRQVRDGERASLYLPALTTKQNTADYSSYKARGLFLEITGRTVSALTAIGLWRQPIINLPKELEDLITMDDIKQAIEELLITGRISLLPDMDADGKPHIALYDAQALYNYMPIDEKTVNWATLKELRYRRVEYDVETVDVIRELVINEEGKYEQIVWEKGADETYKEIERIAPLKRDEQLDFIPLVILTANRVTTDVLPSPMQPIIDLNLWHYHRMADYSHGLHWCALPTPFFKGNFEGEIGLGSGTGIICRDEWGDAKYLEFSGAGLQPIEKAIDFATEQMAAMGAKLLQHDKKSAESGEALRIRQAAETTNIASIVASIEGAFHIALQTISDWTGIKFDPEEAFQLQRDFVSLKLSPQEISAYMQTYQGGGMSLQTLIQELRLGEIGTNTVKEEIALIDSATSDYFDDDKNDDDDDEEKEEGQE